ncbi:hypothetical protein F902_00648 [Acinetobacter higginsii]|uniref:Glycosyltransferase 2-like domain-containing protein n=2 Tax=Moraxellaceae TaxID=468 RepID=N9T3E8_9GAMM|nr:hypothetical protein F902_00648 [Acinetobacter higginsii]
MPAYNSEKYIEKTLESILMQNDVDWQCFEIIVVNDGSSDNTENSVNEFKERNPNIDIIVINKENGGLSDARNYGLKQASGNYIWFFDSDDLMEKDTLMHVLNTLQRDNLDLLSLGMRDVFNSYSKDSNMLNKPVNVIVDGLTYVSKYDVEYSACVFIVKRKLLIDNNVFFLKGVLSEDYDFVLRLYQYCRRISHLGIVCYNYIVKDGSLSRRRDEAYYTFHHTSMIKIINNLKESFKGNNIYQAAILKHIIRIKIIALINLMNSTLSFSDKKRYYMEFKEAGFLDLKSLSIISFSFKQKIIMLLVFTKLFYPLMYLKSKNKL